MKKSILTLWIVLSPLLIQALPVGNPCDASLLSRGVICDEWLDSSCFYELLGIKAGFYGDYVFESHMEVDGGSGKDIDTTRLFTNAGYLALNLCNRLDIFTTLGASNIYLETNTAAFDTVGGAPTDQFILETATDFSWSVGTRATLWKGGCFCLGSEFQYFHTSPTITSIQSGNSLTYPGLKTTYREWQLSLGAVYCYHWLAPYLAVKWSRASLDSDNTRIDFSNFNKTTTLFNLESKNVWGYALGISLIGCEKASITVEGRFGNELACHVNGQVRF